MDRVMLIGDLDIIYNSIISIVFKGKINLVYVAKNSIEAISKCEEYYPDIIIYQTSVHSSNLASTIQLFKEHNNRIRIILL
ncbi:hypothetical protein [Clostridium tunisiense]|uniref:hypothetical protein n=1 Tax=Clostridium tunisiense TaxID=219748 RepID=UPI000381D0B5|nr:hypothetical protein [Clostridium tunisiense]